jgi:uncharacterized protein
LSTTPVKGLAMQESPAVFVTDRGVEGDRAFFLMDENDRLFSAARSACFLGLWARYDATSDVLAVGSGDETLIEERVVAEERVLAHFFGDRHVTGEVTKGPWSDLLSDISGEPLRLVRATGPLGGYDVHPISVVADASIKALTEDRRTPALDGRRFRMTVTLEGLPPFCEDSWVGELVSMGESMIRITTAVGRCAAVRRDPAGLDDGPDPLRLIKETRGTATTSSGRGLHLGVYADVVRAGLVRCGDSVRLVS